MSLNPNMEAIETVSVTSAVSSITFSNIPQTYTDLVLLISARTDGSEIDRLINLTFNGSTSGYSTRELLANGTTVTSLSWSSAAQIFLFQMAASSATANTFGNIQAYIPNYASSNNKSLSCDGVTETNANSGTNRLLSLSASLWANSAAITSINLTPQAGNFVQHSTATLYGITSAGKGAYATGGVITETSTHWIHSFYASGTFTPTQNLTAEYLVVAGGGSGGYSSGGGGGGGGFRTNVGGTALSVTSGTGYTVTIGAGGAGPASSTSGNKGSNSVFSSITSTGGGYGGERNQSYPNGVPGGNGGSGGGGAGAEQSPGRPAGTGNEGGYSPSEGNNGGVGTGPAGNFAGGGGGGAGATGNAASGSTGGNGGNGSSSSISGSAVTYAGGGGGGPNSTTTRATGGTGGGGDSGLNASAAVAGTINTGGGSGGGGNGSSGGAAGGSGIVIIRYAK